MEFAQLSSRELGHVSWERVCPARACTISIAFCDTGRGEEPDWLTREMQQRDPAAVISQTALMGSSALCRQALDLFVALYGAEAGNVALKFMATAGVYVGGGIAPKIIHKLTDSAFMDAFVAKGRLKPLLEAIPVRIIMNGKGGVAGRRALRHAAGIMKARGRASMVKFAPSILAADFWRLGEQVKAAERRAPTASISMSWTGGSSNLGLGIPIVEAMRRGTSLPLEMH